MFGIALPVSVSVAGAGVVSAVRLCDVAIVVTSIILVTVVTGVEDGRVGFSIALTFYGYGYYDIRGGISLRDKDLWIGISQSGE